MDAVSGFLQEIETYLAESGMKPTTFGKLAMGDPRFVATMRDGRAPNLSTVDRVRKFITDNPAEKAA